MILGASYKPQHYVIIALSKSKPLKKKGVSSQKPVFNFKFIPTYSTAVQRFPQVVQGQLLHPHRRPGRGRLVVEVGGKDRNMRGA